ncbi:MAG TPA: permease [Chthoniobacterales bacterium]|nr:permease [Chthoniobacterales bacterium]
MSWFHFNLQDFSISFLSILFEGVPFMFIGTLLSGVIDAFVPAERVKRLLPSNRTAAVALSGLLGVIFPMCECGVVPVIRRLIRKGLPVSCGLTYLLAAPIVNPIVALSTFAAFRGQHPGAMTSLRLTLGFAVAVVFGLIVQRIPLTEVLNRRMLSLLPNARTRRNSSRPLKEPVLAVAGNLTTESVSIAFPIVPPETIMELHDEAHHEKTFGGKVIGAIRCAAFDFLDVGFYLIIGAAIASVFNTAVDRHVLLPLASHHLFATLALMVLALLLSLCSTSDAFIAANFLAFPASAKLAFMVFGPMMDLKLLFMYGLVFTKRLTFSLAIALFVVIATLAVWLVPLLR